MMLAAVAMRLMSPLAEGLSAFPLFEIMFFFSFYMAGVLFQAPYLPDWAGPVAGLAWAGSCLAALTLGVWDYHAIYMLPAVGAGSAMLIWIAQRIQGMAGLLSYVGQNVIAIFVMHILATAGLGILLLELGIGYPGVHVVIGTLGGVCLPLLVLWVLQKLGVARWIGLPAGQVS
tara:strand:+ start:1006 stop:1527 length:522 start_codon:yes stop_codon:yes gene_type:complete